MIRGLSVLLLIVLPGVASAQIMSPIMAGGKQCCSYYITNAGNDACDGTSPAIGASGHCAFKTISKVNGTTLTPGQSVGFKSGDTWRETLTPGQSGTAGNPITFGAYGSGVQPVISGADILTGGGWTQVNGGGSALNLIYDNFRDNMAYHIDHGWLVASGAGITFINQATHVVVDGTNTAPYYYQTYANQTECWTEFTMTVESITAVNGNNIQGFGLKQTASSIKLMLLGLKNASGTNYFQLITINNGSQVTQQLTAAVSLNHPYNIVMHWKAATAPGANNGIEQIWIDGTSYYSVTNANNDQYVANYFQLGNNARTTMNATYDITNIKVGSTGAAPTSPASSNVWAWTFTPAGTVYQPLVVRFGGTYGLVQQTRFVLTSSNNWMYEFPGNAAVTGGGVLYVYATSSPTVQADNRDSSLLVNHSYLTFNDLTLDGGNLYNVNLNAGTGLAFNRETFQYGGDQNIVTATVSGGTISGCSSSHAGSAGIDFSNVTNWTVQGCTSTRDGIFPEPSGPYALRGEMVYGVGIKAFGASVTGVVFSGNTASFSGIRDDGYQPDNQNKGYGIWLDTTILSGNTVTGNVAHDNAIAGLYSEKTQNAVWSYNVAYSNPTGLKVTTDTAPNPVVSTLWANNTLYGNGTNFSIRGLLTGSANDVINNSFRNNLLAAATTRELSATFGGENDGTNGHGNVYTYNGMGPEAASFIEWGSGMLFSTYASWNGAAGAGAGVTDHYLNADPMFVNPGGMPPDFHLMPGSPAIGAGVFIPGVSTANPPNLGAF